MAEVARLLDSSDVRTALRLTDANLVLAVTDTIFRGVVEHSAGAIDASRYRRVVASTKGFRFPAYIHIPGFTDPSGPPGPPSKPSGGPPHDSGDLHHRCMILVDTEKYTSRLDNTKGPLRSHLKRIVRQAIAGAGISKWHEKPMRIEGDSLCVFFTADIPKNRLLHPFSSALRDQLEAHNKAAPEAERMRLRTVISSGDLRRDEDGYYSTPVDEAFGLLNSDELRSSLTCTDASLVVAVTEDIYQGVVRHGYDEIDPTKYERITVQLKRRMLKAWVTIPPTTGAF